MTWETCSGPKGRCGDDFFSPVLLGLGTPLVSRGSTLDRESWEGASRAWGYGLHLWSKASRLASRMGEILDYAQYSCGSAQVQQLYQNFSLGGGVSSLLSTDWILLFFSTAQREGENNCRTAGLSFPIDKIKEKKKDWPKLKLFLDLTLWGKLSAAHPGSSAVVAVTQNNAGENSPLPLYTPGGQHVVVA